MTADRFRRMALKLPGAEERRHHGHPDFRVGGKIFATMAYPDNSRAMVKLTPEQQSEFVAASPKVFEAVTGAWGRQGCTSVHLRAATKASLQGALVAAWCNAAPKLLAQQFEASFKL